MRAVGPTGASLQAVLALLYTYAMFAAYICEFAMTRRGSRIRYAVFGVVLLLALTLLTQSLRQHVTWTKISERTAAEETVNKSSQHSLSNYELRDSETSAARPKSLLQVSL